MEIAELFKLYGNDVFRYSMFKLRNREDSQDVTSETFLRYMQQNNIEEIKDNKVWLIGIARNVIYEKFRQLKKDSAVVINEDNEEVVGLNPQASDSEDEALTEELIELIKTELDKLDEGVREILILKIWEDLQFNQIASVVHENESTVKLRYYRGLEKLKIALGERKKVKSNKLYSTSIPLLILGIGEIGKSSQFILNTTLITNIANTLGVGANLLLNTATMNSIISGKGILSLLTSKVAIGSAVVITAAGAVGTIAVINNDDSPNETVLEETPVSYVPKKSEGEKIEEVADTGIKYKITNADGSTVELVYPKDWEVKTYNEASTFGFVAPNGSAFGYDFGQYYGLETCKDTSKVDLNGDYAKYRRYYDTTNEGVNWYVCQHNSENNSYYVDNASLFTIYAKEVSDLTVIDKIIKSLKVTGRTGTYIHSGRVFDVKFEYSRTMGSAISRTTKETIDGNPFCVSETIHFSNSLISVNFDKGFYECTGSSGGTGKIDSIVSKDGKTFDLYVYEYSYDGTPLRTLTAEHRIKPSAGSSNGVDNQVIRFQVGNLIDLDFDMQKELMEDMIKTLTFDPSHLKSEDFDQVYDHKTNEVFQGRVFKFDFEYAKDLGLGELVSKTNKTLDSNGNMFCASENITSADGKLTISILKGWPECVGVGQEITDYTITKSRDGKEFKTTVVTEGSNTYGRSIYGPTAIIGPSGDRGYYLVVRISFQGADSNSARSTIENIIKTISYDPLEFRSENFDTVRVLK
jgi:RNA polymerase sigma factor (sigma-70 family)